MTKGYSPATASMIAVMFLAFSVSAAQAAGSCPNISYAAERAKLQKLLVSRDFTRDEQAFLLKGADRRIAQMPKGQLNARGAKCGIKTVRALVLGCLNETLPEPLSSIPSSPDRKIGKALWSKANVSAREAVVIGMFHACRASAADAFLSGE